MSIIPDDVKKDLRGELTEEEATAIVERTRLVDPVKADQAVKDVAAALAARMSGKAVVDTLGTIALIVAKVVKTAVI